MRGLFLFVFIFIFQATIGFKASCSTITEVDKLNQRAYRIYLTNPDLARKMSEKALLMAKAAHYKHGIGVSFYNIGLTYWAQSHPPISIYYLKNAVANLTDKTHLVKAYSIIGRNYTELGNYKAATSSFNKAGKYAVERKHLVSILTEKSYMLRRQKRIQLAEQTALKSLSMAKAEKDTLAIAILYYRLGYLQIDQNNLTGAKKYLDSCLLYKSYTPINLRLLASVHIGYSEIENKKPIPDYSNALMNAKRGLSLSKELGILGVISRAYVHVVNTYKKQGDVGNALIYLTEHKAISDSIKITNERKSAALYNAYFNLNLRLNKLEYAEKEKIANEIIVKSQKLYILLLSAGLILAIGLISLLFYYFFKARNLSETLKDHILVLEEQHKLIESQAVNLNKSNLLKDKLLGVIGHDLRMPISNLQSVVDLFHSDGLTVDEATSLIREIAPIVAGADLTLNNLISWAKSQTKGLHFNATEINLYSLVQEIQLEFYHPLKKKDISIHNNIAPDFKIKADLHHIKIILRNLLSNAIKFTPDNGLITAASETHDNRSVISVSDTGIGMSEEDLTLLFNPGFHYSKSGTRGEMGTGIGFSLCKELIELNGGKLSVESTLGKGTTFCFTTATTETRKINVADKDHF